MTKFDRMDVFFGDPEPPCFGQVHGCCVSHCYFGAYCYDRSFRDSWVKVAKPYVE